LQNLQTLSQSVPALHVMPWSSSGMQQDLPLFGPSVQRPLSEADEQLVDVEPELDVEPLVPPLVPLPEVPLVPPLVPLVPPDVVPPELEPLPSSDEEHAATETAKRRETETEAMRAMFMARGHGRSADVAPISGDARRFHGPP
jgi:hypothetical protein